MRWRMTAAALALAAATGCREGVEPFTPPGRVLPDPLAYQLTFGAGSERDPAWAGADSLVYHTDELVGTLPQARGILAAIPANGRPARLLFPEAQLERRLLATPVPAPAGDRVAYMDVGRFDFGEQCYGGTAAVCMTTQARLDSATLRVRRIDETQSFTDDPSVRMLFEGRTPGTKFSHLGPYYEPLYPFQAEHMRTGAMLFRPSWSPDGERLAFSDGLAVRVWTLGEASAAVVPGTMDGVSVAWSPDGQQLAFTLLERGDSITYACECGHDIDHPFINTRVLYDIAARTIVLVRPDGSDRRELGPGEDPAWSPDNRYIYATRDDQIVRIDVADGSTTVVPNTTRGRTPAVSPDGQRLAFARRIPDTFGPVHEYNIWIVALSQ